MKLIDLLELDNITTHVPFTSKKRLFELLAEKLAKDDRYSMSIYNSLVKREKLGNTSLGNGIAFPHGKCLKDKEIRVHLLILKKDVNYENVDDVPVRVIVGVAFPEVTGPSHKKMMTDAVSFFTQHRLYKLILEAKNKSEILDNIMSYFQQCNN